jgi:hypothetical protein
MVKELIAMAQPPQQAQPQPAAPQARQVARVA